MSDVGISSAEMNDMKSDLVLETKRQEKIIEFKHVAVNYKERKSFFKTEKYQALKDVTFDVFKGLENRLYYAYSLALLNPMPAKSFIIRAVCR